MEKEVRIPLPVPPTVAVLRASLSVRWVKYSLWQNQCMDPDVELATALRRLREADHAGVIRLICL